MTMKMSKSLKCKKEEEVGVGLGELLISDVVASKKKMKLLGKWGWVEVKVSVVGGCELGLAVSILVGNR